MLKIPKIRKKKIGFGPPLPLCLRSILISFSFLFSFLGTIHVKNPENSEKNGFDPPLPLCLRSVLTFPFSRFHSPLTFPFCSAGIFGPGVPASLWCADVFTDSDLHRHSFSGGRRGLVSLPTFRSRLWLTISVGGGNRRQTSGRTYGGFMIRHFR